MNVSVDSSLGHTVSTIKVNGLIYFIVFTEDLASVMHTECNNFGRIDINGKCFVVKA